MSSRGSMNIWSQAKRVLSKNTDIPAASFNNFIEPLKLEEVGDNYYVLTAPNQAILNGALKKYQATITKAFSEVTKNNYEVRIQLHLDKRKSSDPYRDSNAPILLLRNFIAEHFDVMTNEFSGLKLIKKKSDRHFQLVTKEFYSDLIFELKQDKRFNGASKEDIGIVIDVIGKTKLNPIKELFEHYKGFYDPEKDGDLVKKIFSLVKIDNDFDFTHLMEKWLLRAIHQVMEPKFVNEHLLMFQGNEGLLKTTFITSLFPDWLDAYIEFGQVEDALNKDFIEKLSNKFIWFIDEWDEKSRKVQKQLKSILSLNRDERRRAYAEFATTYHRITSFMTALNSEWFLHDDKKSRRNIVVTVSEAIDIKRANKVDKTKLWGQLYQKYLAMPDKNALHWTLEEQKTFHKNNERYRMNSSEVSKVLNYYRAIDPAKFDKGNEKHLFLTSTELIEHLQGIDPELAGKLSHESLGRFLKNHNFSMKATPWRKYYIEYFLTV